MSRLRVEKQAVPATFYLADGSSLEGHFFLAPFSPARRGPQTVEDLMVEPGWVLPFSAADGSFLLLGKHRVAAVAVPLRDHRPSGFWTPVPVRIRLSGPHEIEGGLLVEEGLGDRLSDFLKSSEAWLALETRDSLFWVSKDHLVSLRSSP